MLSMRTDSSKTITAVQIKLESSKRSASQSHRKVLMAVESRAPQADIDYVNGADLAAQ